MTCVCALFTYFRNTFIDLKIPPYFTYCIIDITLIERTEGSNSRRLEVALAKNRSRLCLVRFETSTVAFPTFCCWPSTPSFILTLYIETKNVCLLRNFERTNESTKEPTDTTQNLSIVMLSQWSCIAYNFSYMYQIFPVRNSKV